MKIWIETRTVEQPDFTVMARFGASIMDVGYERLLDQWLWLQPKGVREKIAEPPEIFVEEQWALAHKLAKPRGRREEKATRVRRRKGDSQLMFDL